MKKQHISDNLTIESKNVNSKKLFNSINDTLIPVFDLIINHFEPMYQIQLTNDTVQEQSNMFEHDLEHLFENDISQIRVVGEQTQENNDEILRFTINFKQNNCLNTTSICYTLFLPETDPSYDDFITTI